MPQQGWIVVRNVPDTGIKDSKERNGIYHDALADFFDKHKVCPKCKGLGYTLKKELPRSKSENIKIHGVKSMEEIHGSDNPRIIPSDVIREVISFQLEGRRVCSRCKGNKFLKKKSSS